MKHLFNKFKKIILVFMAILMLSLSLAPSAKAAVTTSWYNQSFNDWFLRVYTGNDSEIFGERYTAAQVQWILYSIYSQMISVGVSNNMDVVACVLGPDISTCTDAITTGFRDLITYEKGINTKSVIATITSSPISGVGYIKNIIAKFSLIPSVNAQEGFGFTAVNPIQILWKISRDISYGLLVVAIIVFAFMIMFKIKINPQTVVTIQSALPKVVISSILITFSYAIAGLLIDLMYVFLALIIAILTSDQYKLFAYNFTEMIGYLLGRNIFEIFMGYWFGFVVTSFATIFSAAGSHILLGFILTLFAIFSIFILIFLSIKTIYLLLKNFAMLLLTIATGPLEILLGTVTFSGGGFGSWLKRIASYLAVYPIITVLILLAHFFLAQGMPQSLKNSFSTNPEAFNILPFNPNFGVLDMPGNTNWNVPYTVGEQLGMPVIWIIVSYVLITLIPKVFDMIKSFMEKQPFKYDTGIGNALGTGRFVGETATNIQGVLSKLPPGTHTPRWAENLLDKLKWLSAIPKT